MLRHALAVVVLMLVASVGIGAQAEPGQIIGVVKDTTGGALPGVTVTLTAPDVPARKTVSEGEGTYQFARVPPGTYTMKFELGPFFPLERANVVVGAGRTVQVNVGLALGPTSEVSHPNRPRVRIDTAQGAFVLELDMDRAPLTVANFLKYVDGGFYSGGRFHRATRPENYTPAPPERPAMQIIQGGINAERATEAEAAIPPVPLERTTVTGLKHVAGVVSMARGAGADSGRSDFFILLDDQPSMDVGGRRYPDGQGFAAFGRVVDGLDVVKKINALPVQGQSLTPPVPIRSITRLPPGRTAIIRLFDTQANSLQSETVRLKRVGADAPIEAQTDRFGQVRLTAVPPGVYHAEAAVQGFSQRTAERLIVTDTAGAEASRRQSSPVAVLEHLEASRLVGVGGTLMPRRLIYAQPINGQPLTPVAITSSSRVK